MAKGHIIIGQVKHCLPVVILTVIALSPVLGQDSITYNHYTRILSVENRDTTDIFDSVIVDDPALFVPGEIAMFYQVKGLQVYPPGHPSEGEVNRGVGNPNTGKYTLIRVYDVDLQDSAVIFSTYLPAMGPPGPLRSVPADGDRHTEHSARFGRLRSGRCSWRRRSPWRR